MRSATSRGGFYVHDGGGDSAKRSVPGRSPSTESHRQLWMEGFQRRDLLVGRDIPNLECDPGTKPTLELVLSRVYLDDRSLVQQQIDRAPRDRDGFDFEHRLQLPDGSVKHVRVTAHPSGDSAENLEFVGAITDITQQRRAEAVIRTQEAELRDVIDTIPAIAWSALPDGSNSYVNSRLAEYFGMRPEQIAGTRWHVVTH